MFLKVLKIQPYSLAFFSSKYIKWNTFSTKVGRSINKALEMLLNVLSLVQVFAWLKTLKGFKASADTLLKGPTLMAENQDGRGSCKPERNT